MQKIMAKKDKNIKSKGKSKGKSVLKMMLLAPLMLGCMIFFKAAFVLFMVAMLPTIIAGYTDHSDDRIKVSTIGCCNFAGILPYLVPFAQQGGEWKYFDSYLNNFHMWLIVYGMAACGYGLIKFCPAIYHSFLRISYAGIVLKTEAQQESLLKEWGSDIAGLAMQNTITPH
jgi:hypothetical protein